MDVDTPTVLAILGMALATFASRAGGFFFMRRVRPTRFVEAWLKHIPGAMFVALVVPTVVAGGPTAWAGAAAAAAVSAWTGMLLPSLVAGVGVIAILRAVPI